MKAHGRSLADFGPLKPAEQSLLDCCRFGTMAKIGPVVPEEPSTDNTVRAGFLRFLVLGGDGSAPVHERGVQLKGAYIQGWLNLNSTVVPSPLLIQFCHVQREIILTDATFAHSLVLSHSTLHGLDASRVLIEGRLFLIKTTSSGKININGAHISGHVSCSGAQLDGCGSWALSAENVLCGGNFQLRGGFSAKGGVNLMAAKVEGQLACEGGITASTGPAFQADRIHVKGSVFFYKGFSSVGTLRFLGANVHGQFNCNTARLNGNGRTALSLDAAVIAGSLFLGRKFSAVGSVVLHSTHIKGDLVMRGADRLSTLSAKRINIGGALVLRDLLNPLDSASFAGGRAGSLDDDKKSWGKDIDLDGFVFKFIHVHSAMSITDRLDWLSSKQRLVPVKAKPVEFRPQPWRHLQSVLDEMGHAEEARQVGIEFEKRLRAAGLIGQSPKRWNPLRRYFYKKLMTFLHVMYGYLTGYGYRPMLLLRSFLMVWLVCSGIYWLAANEGAIFAPSDPLVFQNEKYASCMPPASPTGQEPSDTGNWYLCAELPEAYTGFSPLAFSLDLLLPLVDLHQEKDWAPLIETPKANIFAELWGFFSAKRLVRFVMWVEILAGWGFSLLFVAVVSGLARRKE
ncbi:MULTISPECIES: membrane-associated oxidoreductase [Pseudomonas syringae group]|uniref:membrane-associated oxidoreductase n=1 Tax=Pseudomonas syringae group TaxID=136849 RepID=UPI0006E65DB2|nr:MULTISPECIES: membrane-associated oxidoreductase [Pseudomonas syringae group]KPX48165.1 Uncharacterized protein ALO69_00206 [Pseudomonas ficuserectae]MDU8607816.1 membrane-associated oxidoreductase [Pseudomonas syringae group sp. 247E2]RMS37505.1 hypothetical protein ALP68_00365 [Pseudomonas ficuserectae]RMS39467.1 hypothetical protein ALP67_03209 [Pseudomonas ficuserectae]